MSALGNGSQFSEFKSGSALPSALPSATNSGPLQVNMQSKSIGGKKSAKRKSAKRKSGKKSISNKIKSIGKKMIFWK